MSPKKQILVIEDNELNREMLRAILSDEYIVLEAENGQQGMEVLIRNKDTVALILLDMMMPVMDGYAFLDRIKSDPDLSLVPVIVTTQSGSEANEVDALSRGATDFVPKPYSAPVILHRVASIIKLRETAAMVNQFKFDRLTGLYSKEFFYQMVRRQIQENPDREYSIICSNVENFKLYNDTFGVPAGDRLLKEIAGLFQSAAGSAGFCGRSGADRFLCLQEREQELKDRHVFDQSEPVFSPLLKNVVMRWGIYEISDRSVPVEQMCDRALLAVDSIKGQYNRPYAVYDDALRSKLLREQAITESMEDALKQRQFSVYLQPKYSLDGGRLAGAEALVRWKHPELGFISPGEFIPIFEKNGFISQLDHYMWEQSCTLLHKWKSEGLYPPPISVNMSRADVYQAGLDDTLVELVDKYGLSPADLHLEITESAYTENPGQIISTVDHLRTLGFVIELDDFGSGYSSLNMLSRMKLDVLKLDMKFMQDQGSSGDPGILRFIVDLARWLKLSVVAEGVETQEQVDLLRGLGCDYAQGYFFARPMPSQDYEKLLAEQLPALQTV